MFPLTFSFASKSTTLSIRSQNYRWWWRSYMVSASAGIYMMIYAVFSHLTKLQFVRASSIIRYYGYMGLISVLFSLMTGAIGFFASHYFTRKIYSLVKSS